MAKDVKPRLKDFFLPTKPESTEPVIKLDKKMATAIAKAMDDLLKNLPAAEDQDQRESLGAGFEKVCRKPETLPVSILNVPALEGRDPVLWERVGRLPAYVDPRIRKLGETMFNSFPCFKAYSEAEKAQGRDGQAQIRTISDMTNSKAETAFMAKIIQEHGQLLEVGEADFGELVPGYRPKLAIFLTESWTFKLVMERLENGAPINANYIYAWPGGTNFYQNQAPAPEPIGITDGQIYKP